MRRQFPVVAIMSMLALPMGAAAADLLYVTNLPNDETNISRQRISVIDTDQGDMEVATINLEFDAATGDPLTPLCIALTPDGNTAFISTDAFILDDGGNVFIIDSASHTVSGAPFRFPPQGQDGGGGNPCVVISPDGARAYLSNESTGASGNSKIVAISTNENPPMNELLNVNTGNFTTGAIALSPDGSTLFALHSVSGLTSEVLKIVGLDGISPSVSRIQFSDTFDRFSDRLVSDLAFAANGNLYVTMIPNSGPPTVQVLDAVTGGISEIALSSSAGFAGGIAMTSVTPTGEQFAYITLPLQGEVVRVDTATNTVIGAPIPVGDFPVKIAISPTAGFAYVTNFTSEDITVINTTDNSVDRTIASLGGGPYQIAVLLGVPEEPVASLDSFQCLEARKLYTPRRYKYKKFGGITHLKLRSRGLGPENFCSPVKVNDQPISDSTTHLTCYEKKHWKYHKFIKRYWSKHKGHGHRSNKQIVTVQNDLVGEHPVIIRDPDALCVSTGVDGTPPAVEPDHFFKCFEAKKPWDTQFEKVEVTIDDGSGPETVTVKKPKAFCIPVNENYEAIDDATDNLTCYKITSVRLHRDKYSKYQMWNSWKHRHKSSSQKVTVNNVFGDEQKLRIGGDKTLCVPSRKLMSEVFHWTNNHDDDEKHDHKKEEKEKDD